MMKKRKISVILMMAAVLFCLFCGCGDDGISYSAAKESPEKGTELSASSFCEKKEISESGSDSEKQETETDKEKAEKAEPDRIQVYVCGAVANPGVYTLSQGSRVYEAVAMAGGLLETADEKALNQARELTDGEQVTVLTVEEIKSGAMAGQDPGTVQQGSSSDGSGGKENLNTADESMLMTIPGIGESRAAAIIAYREKNGRFETIEEIMEIEGIKEKMFEKIRDSITV